LFWDNTNKRLGIGVNNPPDKLYIRDNIGGANANFRFFGNVTAGYTAFISMDNIGLKLGTQTSIRNLEFQIDSITRWGILTNGILQSNGAQTIQTSTGNLTLATGGGNGNINITPNGTGILSVTGAATFSSSVKGTFNSVMVGGPGNHGLEFVNATTSTKALIGGYDSTNGAYIQAVNFGTAYEKLLLNPNGGNVGIGTASPSARLDIVSTGTGSEGLRIDGAGGGFAFVVRGGSTYTTHIRAGATIGESYFTTPPVNGLIVQGNVGIGTASPGQKLVLEDPSACRFDVIRTGGAAGRVSSTSDTVFMGSTTSHPLVLFTADLERMRITTAGTVLVGVSDINSSAMSAFVSGYNGIGSKVSNNAFYLFSGLNTSDATTFFVLGNGDVRNTNNSYGAISDIKLKENIEDATPKLDDLLKVKVRNYNLIGDDKKQIGVIAQELEEVFPLMVDELEDFEEVEVPQLDEEGNEVLNEEGEVVTTKQRVSKGTTTKSVKYSVFVPMLIKAIQELKTEIDSLKNQIK
jgi:hypothetical protein